VNHIQRLQRDLDEAQAKLTHTLLQVEELRSYLFLPKFVGVDTNGDRKDWVATGDVLARLNLIRLAAQGIA
jgi:hypothetical protein